MPQKVDERTAPTDAALTQLTTLGFTTVPEVLPSWLVERLRKATDRLCADRPLAERDSKKAQGTMIGVMEDPLFADLIAWSPALEVLRRMGFRSPTFTNGYVISKPPGGPRLFWHYDWFAWRDPGAFDVRPQQVFFMYYLTDTNRANGCLRVIPGSHRTRHSLHDVLGNPHDPSLSRADDPSSPAFGDAADEVDVPVRAGDLVIGDARMLHAAHANASSARRTVITLWFQPDFANLPERVQAQMVQKTQPIPDGWPTKARAKVRALQPRYDGSASPYGRDLYPLGDNPVRS